QKLGLASESIASIAESDVLKAPDEIADALCAPLLQEPRNFYCFVAVSGSIKDATRIFHGSKFPRISRKRLRADTLAANWYEVHREEYMVQVETVAMSNREAAEKALVAINTLLN